MGPVVLEICAESGGNKKIKWWRCFLILVGSILLLSAEKAYQKINCLWPYLIYRQPQTEVECTCSVVQCTLHVHGNPNSVAGVYTACAVKYTLQAAGYTASTLLLVIFIGYTAHCSVHWPCSTRMKLQCSLSCTRCSVHWHTLHSCSVLICIFEYQEAH